MLLALTRRFILRASRRSVEETNSKHLSENSSDDEYGNTVQCRNSNVSGIQCLDDDTPDLEREAGFDVTKSKSTLTRNKSPSSTDVRSSVEVSVHYVNSISSATDTFSERFELLPKAQNANLNNELQPLTHHSATLESTSINLLGLTNSDEVLIHTSSRAIDSLGVADKDYASLSFSTSNISKLALKDDR